MKKLKTKRVQVAEKCNFVDDSNLLHLLGCEVLCSDLRSHQKIDPSFTCDCNNFSVNFSTEDKFYYQLEHYKSRELLYTEIGLGELITKDLEFYIDRKVAMLYIVNGQEPSIGGLFYKVDELDADEYLHVKNLPPSRALEILIDPHVMLGTGSDGCPSPIYVEDNSFIGRIGGDIQSFPLTSIISPETILSTFSSLKKSLSTQAYKFYCRLLNCKSLVISPSKKPKRSPKGSIVFDENDLCLKIFDGNTWKVIQTNEET